MRSTLRCLLACLLCILLPSVGHAGPIRDSLRDVSAKQAAPRSREVAAGCMGGWNRPDGRWRRDDDRRAGPGHERKDREPGCESIGIFGELRPRDPNSALIGAGAAAVGAGIIMIFLGRNRPAPQIMATPGKFAIQHSVKF